MQHSDGPWNELAKAEAALGQLRVAVNVADRRTHWHHFLHAIERTWSKSVAHFKKSPKWSNWHKPYLDQRKDDPLLKYLTNARGAEEHADAEVVDAIPASVTFDVSAESGTLEFEMIDGEIKVFGGDAPIIGHQQEIFRPIAIVNRGVTYAPPTTHLDSPIDASDAIVLAEAALSYYRVFLNAAEAKFVS